VVTGGVWGAGEGWNGSRGSGELTGRLPAARTRPETRERRRGGTPGGSGNSGEEFWPGRGGLECAKAWTSYDRVRGTLWTKARAQGRANSTSHCAGTVNRHDRTPAKPNWPRQSEIGTNQAWEPMSHLGTDLWVAWRGL
jgi:hypothetical protein